MVHDYRAARDDVYVEQPDAPKRGWVDGLPGGEPSHISLARVVDADAGRDEAENSYYESAADRGPYASRPVGDGFAAGTYADCAG